MFDSTKELCRMWNWLTGYTISGSKIPDKNIYCLNIKAILDFGRKWKE